jgi:two-component system response regulator NreC
MIDLGVAAHPRQIIRVLLVDDHVVFRAALRALLERQADCEVVGEAGTGEEAVVCVKEERPDVVLMDLAMPGEGGIAATREIAALGFGTTILVLTGHPQDPHLLEALDAGARGFVEKVGPVEDLMRAIRSANATHLFLCPDAAQLIVLERYRRDGRSEDETTVAGRLSELERHVLGLLAQGYTVRETAGRLAVSPKTVRVCRTRFRDRLGLRDRPDLVGFAARTGLLEAQ